MVDRCWKWLCDESLISCSYSHTLFNAALFSLCVFFLFIRNTHTFIRDENCNRNIVDWTRSMGILVCLCVVKLHIFFNFFPHFLVLWKKINKYNICFSGFVHSWIWTWSHASEALCNLWIFCQTNRIQFQCLQYDSFLFSSIFFFSWYNKKKYIFDTCFRIKSSTLFIDFIFGLC